MAYNISNIPVIDDDRRLVNTRVAFTVISTNTQATASTYYIASQPLTLTLPSNPLPGDYVGFVNRSNSTDCVISRNGSNITALSEDFQVDVFNAAFELVYVDVANGWVVV